MTSLEIRRQLLAVCRKLPANNLATGSTGNISARDPAGGGIVIKRTSIPYDEMTEDDFVVLDPDGAILSAPGGTKPSFETPTHLALYKAFPEVGAILHTHIPMTIVLAAGRDAIESNLTPTGRRLLKKPLPVIPFIENGTEDMAERVTEAIRGNVGVVIRNHGPFIVGESIKSVFERTVALRDVSELYYRMILIGKPSLVPPL